MVLIHERVAAVSPVLTLGAKLLEIILPPDFFPVPRAERNEFGISSKRRDQLLIRHRTLAHPTHGGAFGNGGAQRALPESPAYSFVDRRDVFSIADEPENEDLRFQTGRGVL